MILYTPLAKEDIFPSDLSIYAKRQCINFKNKTLYVEKRNDGTYQLLQLLSTDPNDFLNDQFQPGTIIE
ncbi:YlzJ-like family protein [Virgibacillus sp. 179-BFC.A HS]|uniref:YlzJ-like family protein n=1 Tax=Tigheibacillus jepli TaxID=3035914 RepID=A0ABU5CHY9_9BACI|nr:YlzJ-like family protein [Virgibacillus sp. 179-BFC.A HS]MDY0405830.1 YlzJ-like family protein [Virgibacillus sp. 179-BFC.A HS]